MVHASDRQKLLPQPTALSTHVNMALVLCSRDLYLNCALKQNNYCSRVLLSYDRVVRGPASVLWLYLVLLAYLVFFEPAHENDYEPRESYFWLTLGL